MSVLIVYLVGLLCGFLICKSFVKKGVGKMKVCLSCPYKTEHFSNPANAVNSVVDVEEND